MHFLLDPPEIDHFKMEENLSNLFYKTTPVTSIFFGSHSFVSFLYLFVFRLSLSV